MRVDFDSFLVYLEWRNTLAPASTGRILKRLLIETDLVRQISSNLGREGVHSNTSSPKNTIGEDFMFFDFASFHVFRGVDDPVGKNFSDAMPKSVSA